MKRILSLALVFALIILTVTSCGKEFDGCEYAKTRDVENRDITYVEMKIANYGNIVILLDATTAPTTVENFVKLVNDGFYNGLTFHRVIKDFMIQGGDPNGNGSGGSANKIYGEFSSNGYYGNDISHIRGVISMARTPEPNSATSQFFICNADASKSLDGEYAAFGYVVDGMHVVDKITEEVFPKTAYYEWYGTMYHQYWEYYGNGNVENDEDKPVIEYIKVLENYEKS